MKYFTHYWKNDTWEKNRRLNPPGTLLEHISGEQFRSRGIETGDVGYVITNKKGNLFLCGRLVVGLRCDITEAARITGLKKKELFDADEHIIASEATPMQWDFQVPKTITKQLELVQKGVVSKPLFDAVGRLDRQTFRPVRFLTKSSAELLDRLLDDPQPVKKFHDKNISLWDAPHDQKPDDDADLESQMEGNPNKRYVTHYERNPANRTKAIKIHGLDCKGCGRNFEKRYGEHGKGYIHVHHMQPVSRFEKPRKVDPKTELTVLCADCHSMVHRLKHKTLSLDELRSIIRTEI